MRNPTSVDPVTSHPGTAPDAGADVVVVGAGLAGLTAASHAARSGARTVLLEATAHPGGRARTTERDGVWLNEGPHALYEAGPGMAVLRELGIDPQGARPPTRGMAVAGGRHGALPLDARSLLTTSLLTPRARAAFAALQLRLLRIDARRYDDATITQLLDEWVRPDRGDLRALLAGFVRLTTYVDAPDQFSAGAAIEQLRLANAGVRYLDRGWGSLVAALAAVAARAGVSVEVSTKVTAVEATNGGWLVTAGDTRWFARAVVLAGLRPEAVERLAGRRQGSLRELAGPPVRAACLDLVLAEPPAVGFALDLDRHLYSSVHGPLGGPARTLVCLSRYRRPDDAGDAERDRAELRAFARTLGVESTLYERYLHDMTVTQGLPLAARGGMAGRPTVDALGRDGLYIAGDWVGPEGLLADAALHSGRAAGVLAAARSGARAG